MLRGVSFILGNPDTPILDPNVRMLTDSSWKLSWITKSFANITEYRLLYRKVPVRSETTVDLIHT